MKTFALMALGIVVALGAIAVTAFAHAQSARPQFLLTWSALQSYAPGSYSGKILPNQESQISASLVLVSPAGKIIDLSGQTIYWYLNDTLIGGGIGAQHVIFRPFGTAPNTETLEVKLPDYPGGILIHQVSLPIVAPQIVIDAPYPQAAISGNQALVQGIPYFFTVSSTASLGYAWSVNGQTVADATNPQSLQISLPQGTPSGYSVSITLTAQNAYDSTSATANTTLSYQPTL